MLKHIQHPIRTRVRIALLPLLLLAGLCACTPHDSSEKPKMSQLVHITINEPVDTLNKANPGLFTASEHPSGLQFVTAKWEAGKPGTVTLDHGPRSFSMQSVLSVTGTASARFAAEHISQWSVNGGVSDAETISHDDARKQFTALLHALSAAGWSKVIPISRPRLKGEQALAYALKNPGYPLDPSHDLSLAQWMKLPDGTPWLFYADHVFLEIKLYRDPNRLDPDKRGAYFVTYSLTAQDAYLRGYVDDEKLDNWKMEFRKELPALKQAREKKEAQLRNDNVTIDQAYQDPAVFQ